MMLRRLTAVLAIASAAAWSAPAQATIPYTPVALPPGAAPGLGAGLIGPASVFGKEYSHDVDQNTSGMGGVPDPQQVIAWDGLGGAADGFDFSLTRPNYPDEDQIDAIANHADALFTELRRDRAHLIYSHDDMISVYPAGPPVPFGAPFTPGAFVPAAGLIPTPSGMIGGAGELSYELAGAFAPMSSHGLWADQKTINGMPLPRDVDGVEVWGPEPAFTDDADKYSLQVDAFSGVSIWNKSGSSYLSQAAIVAAVTSPGMLGPLPDGVVLPFPDFIDGEAAINVDALMVRDTVGENDSFDRDPAGGPGDQIIFSISQIVDPTDPDGYYATGSELFVLDASLGVSFLRHGGHAWDHTYALTNFVAPAALVNGYGVFDINAIEAVGSMVVPEPAAALMMLTCFGSAAMMRRRLG